MIGSWRSWALDPLHWCVQKGEGRARSCPGKWTKMVSKWGPLILGLLLSDQWSLITDQRSLVTATSPIWKWRSCKPWLKMFLPISLLSPLPICLLPLCFPSEWKSYPVFSSFCSQPFLRTILAMLQTPWCQVLFPFILIFFSCFKSIILFLVVIENCAINVNLKFWRLKCLFFFFFFLFCNCYSWPTNLHLCLILRKGFITSLLVTTVWLAPS